MSTASVIFFSRSVYCHGTMSSSQAMLYFSSALPEADAAVHADVAEVVGARAECPCRPVRARARRTRPSAATPLSVSSMPVNMCCACGSPYADARAGGHGQRARHVGHEVDAEVHLQPREALVARAPSAAGRRPSGRAIRWCPRSSGCGRGTCRRASGRPGRCTPCRPDPRAPSRLPQTPPPWRECAAELLDLAEELVDVAGVLAEQPALQHQRVVLAGAVAHLAEAVDALVGVDPDERARHRRARTVSARRSVIFRSEGLELVLTFCGSASSVSSAQKPAPALPPRLSRTIVAGVNRFPVTW